MPSQPASTPIAIKHVIVLKTTTVAKTVHYEAIARYLNLPLHFINLTDVTDGFIVADEDTRDRVKNALQKMEDHENVAKDLRTPKSPLRKVLRKRLKTFGIDDKDVEYHMAVEDATITTELPEWQILHDSLAPFVPEALLQGIANNGTQAGPAAETAAVLANVRLDVLMDELRLAALQLGKTTSPKLTSVITFILNRANDRVSPRKVFEGQTSYRAFAPGGLGDHIPKSTAVLAETEDYIASFDDPTKPQSENYLNWLVNVSPRSKIVRELASFLGHAAPEPTMPQLFSASARGTFIRRVEPLHDPVIYSFGKSDPRVGRFKILSSGANKLAPPSLTIEPVLQKADALIFRSMKGLTPAQNTLRLLHFFAALVDRQTRSRAKHRPMIVVDDGSMTRLTDFCVKLYHSGFVKNHLNRPLFQGIDHIVSDEGVAHFSDGYVDVIKSSGKRQLTSQQERTALNQILEFRLASYERFASPQEPVLEPVIGGAVINRDDVTVTYYTSASNDNRYVMDANMGYGKFLAENKFAAAWGGGDLHAMGAFANGYRQGNGHRITCVSTFDLLQNETSTGLVPQGAHRWEVYPDITQRRNSLYDLADIEVVSWGGYGTMEEDVNSEAWRTILPATAIKKYKIFYAPGIHRDDYNDNINEELMRLTHGDTFVDAMLDDHKAHIDKGYVLATTLEELKAITLVLKQRVLEHRMHYGVRPVPETHGVPVVFDPHPGGAG